MKSKRTIAVLTAVLAVTLALFGGRINTAVAHCREKYINEPIARRIMKSRENKQQDQIDLSNVIRSPLADSGHRGDSAGREVPRPHRGLMDPPSVVPSE